MPKSAKEYSWRIKTFKLQSIKPIVIFGKSVLFTKLEYSDCLKLIISKFLHISTDLKFVSSNVLKLNAYDNYFE